MHVSDTLCTAELNLTSGCNMSSQCCCKRNFDLALAGSGGSPEGLATTYADDPGAHPPSSPGALSADVQQLHGQVSTL